MLYAHIPHPDIPLERTEALVRQIRRELREAAPGQAFDPDYPDERYWDLMTELRRERRGVPAGPDQTQGRPPCRSASSNGSRPSSFSARPS